MNEIDPRREPGFADDPEGVTRRRRLDPDDPRVTGEMTFFQHLEELRMVIFHSLIATLAGAIGGWLLAPIVLEDMIHRTVGHALILSPLEAFNERFKLAMVLGLGLALPIVLWRVWSFVVPGLMKREKRWILPMAMMSFVLFALGAWASYGYVVPLVVEVLGQFTTPSMRAEIRLSDLLGFVYNMSIACGVVCQLPLVTMSLTAMGLVTPRFLLQQWRYAIVGSFLVTAIITPGDVFTAQIVMGVPMVFLYFLSVGLSYLVARKKREGEETDSIPEESHAAQP
jgi:sec-independent protein translocase protein TatC